MLTTKNSLKRLNGFIDIIRRNIDNQEVLDYILKNLNLGTKKGTYINFKDNNIILIVDSRRNDAFYLEVCPSMDKIDSIYTRLTKRCGDLDERVTFSFDQDMVKIHKYSSSITKDLDDERITSVTDEFIDKTFVNGQLRFRKHFATNLAYPSIENANSSSNLEETVIRSDGSAAFKKVKVSSRNDDEHQYGIFDANKNNFTSESALDELKEVQIITEDEYKDFASKQEERITKRLK